MQRAGALPDIREIVDGRAIFADDMPVWGGTFGADIWPFVDPASPLFCGIGTCSFVWPDYMSGRGTALNHPNSFKNAKYEYCLTPEIIRDLKVASVIHGHFPKLIKDARRANDRVDPKTVKGRIDELAKFFSMVIREGERTRDLVVSRLDEIPFGLIKEVVPKYPGRSSHLKRALKLISDPMVQKNLRAPLQWTLLDITKSSLAWNEPKDAGGIPTLSDRQFLFLLDRCKYFITRFKRAAGIDIHDIECRSISADEGSITRHLDRDVIDAFYADRILNGRVVRFEKKYGVPAGDVTDLIRDAHLSALMVMLLFTGMRSSETKFLKRGCLLFEHGYWFLKSKVVKAQPKEMPPVEGWLAVDITMDAYEVLSFVCERTGCNYLFSSPFVGYAKSGRGYSGCSLNTKFSRWIKRNDTEGLFFGWHFSVHQCRETLVSQLAKQEVGLPFISMQMKHFHSRLKSMPNAVTAGYGQYRAQLFASVAGRMAEARETALLDVYGETAKFAGGGAERHKARIDAFFSGLGLFGPRREGYIRDMARRGVRLMPTSIGSCTKNFLQRATNSPAPCYGDYQCDPDCHSHVITDRCARALLVRREHALAKMRNESNDDTRDIWAGLANKLDRHIRKLSEASDA